MNTHNKIGITLHERKVIIEIYFDKFLLKINICISINAYQQFKDQGFYVYIVCMYVYI